jgi:hypothetical protein
MHARRGQRVSSRCVLLGGRELLPRAHVRQQNKHIHARTPKPCTALTYSLTHPLTHSFTRSLTHSLTHSPAQHAHTTTPTGAVLPSSLCGFPSRPRHSYQWVHAHSHFSTCGTYLGAGGKTWFLDDAHGSQKDNRLGRSQRLRELLARSRPDVHGDHAFQHAVLQQQQQRRRRREWRM